jgi:hypothetical protein
MMLRHSRRFASTGAKPLAEDIARKIAHELRSSPAALASIDQLGVGHFGAAQLAKYALARSLIHSQYAGCTLDPPRPASLTANGLSPADERLIRAVAALEEMASRRDGRMIPPRFDPSALNLSNKQERTLLTSFLTHVARGDEDALDAPELLARWRYAPCAFARMCWVLAESVFAPLLLLL